MNQDRIKEILLELRNSDLEFTVTLTGKESKKVNGLYKPETQEILLHNKNFKTDNEMIYTAIHEYSHHVMNEAIMAQSAGTEHLKGRVHSVEFWAIFHELLAIAEEKGFYVIGLENSPELAELTENIRKNYLEKNGLLMQEFGKLLSQAHKLCLDANIRYEDYIDRCLKIPRQAAKNITKVGIIPVNPTLGYENMKMIANMSNETKRNEAQNQLLGGQSPDSVKYSMKKTITDIDPKDSLEKEKKRLEKTIHQLTSKLEMVEEKLANM